MVKLHALSPRGHEFDPRLLSYGTLNQSTPPYDLAVSGTLKNSLTHLNCH